MPDLIVSREAIARMADEAAAQWATHPSTPKPANPFDEHLHPEHHRAWKASFERELLRHSAPEAEGSA